MIDDETSAEAPESALDAEWQRARRPEQKAERRRAILEATVALLDEVGVEGATLSAIARRAGLSKANCYRYFETREAILLELTLAESTAWIEAVEARLTPLAGSGDLEAVARVFVETVVERPRLCGLFSAIYSVLERNVSPGAVADFKGEFHTRVFGSGDPIREALPTLTAEDADHFILFFGFLIAGAWPNANPLPEVVAELERRDLARLDRSFERTLLTHSRVVLRGLIEERAERAGASPEGG